MVDTQIREATTDDASTIKAELLLPAFRDDERLDPEFNELDEDGLEGFGCAYWLENDTRTMFVAETDGELIAQISAVKTETPPIYEHGARTHIDGLYVKEEYRRQEIASALIERVETWAMDNDCETLGVTVHTENDGARSLYESEFDLKFHSYRRTVE